MVLVRIEENTRAVPVCRSLCLSHAHTHVHWQNIAQRETKYLTRGETKDRKEMTIQSNG